MENYRNSNCMSRSGCQTNRGDMEARRSSSRTSNTMAYTNSRQSNHSMPRTENGTSCTKPKTDMDRNCTPLCELPLGMGYVPMQPNSRTYNTCLGLQMGTIFPDLCKPFCGKGGACKC